VKLFDPFFSNGGVGEGVSEREKLVAQKEPKKQGNALHEPAAISGEMHRAIISD
jgi:hypothetical protein